MQFHPAEKDRGRDGAVAKEKQPGENLPAEREARLEPVIIQAERLEKTRRPMAQVQGEQEKRENVKTRDERTRKAKDHHGIYVVVAGRILRQGHKTRIGHAEREYGAGDR